jgi:flagellar motor switch protein FliM
MAEDILSQEEVDALLRGVTGEAEEAGEAPPAEAGVRAYDIGRQERIVRGRMPTLELINERFARQARSALSDFMRKGVEVSAGPLRAIRYSEFLRNLIVPTSLNLVQPKPLRGTALVVLEPALVFQVIDHLFGGGGRSQTRVEGREFTPTETRTIQRLLQVILGEYQRAWEPVFPLALEYLRSEMNPQFASIAMASDMVVATSFAVDFGSGSVELHVCMPYTMLEPIRKLIYGSVQTDRSEADQRWLAQLSAQVYGAEVELQAALAHAAVRVKDLLQLQRGDVISLELPDKLVAAVEGVPLLECRYGVVNGHYALKVDRFVSAAGGGDGGERSQG